MRLLKDLTVMSLKELVSRNFGMVFIEHPSLKAHSLAAIRRLVKSAGGLYKIASKRLLGRVIGVDAESASDMVGNSAVAAVFVPSNFTVLISELEAGFKLILGKRFVLNYLCGLMEGFVIRKPRIGSIGSWASREQSLSEVIGVMIRPMMDLQFGLQYPMLQLVSILEQIAGQGRASGEQ